MRTLVTGASLRDVVIHTTRKMVQFPSPADYVRIQLAATPLASIFALYDAAYREGVVGAMIEDVAAALAPHTGREVLSFPQEVHTVLAIK